MRDRHVPCLIRKPKATNRSLAAVVLLHGNGVTAHDFMDSGVIKILAGQRRVIEFDRPGTGPNERPRPMIRKVFVPSLIPRSFEAFPVLPGFPLKLTEVNPTGRAVRPIVKRSAI
jgi:pimeloyl-ACP methyl ester carboxylesterase